MVQPSELRANEVQARVALYLNSVALYLETIERAVIRLGLEREVGGLNLVEKADKCLVANRSLATAVGLDQLRRRHWVLLGLLLLAALVARRDWLLGGALLLGWSAVGFGAGFAGVLLGAGLTVAVVEAQSRWAGPASRGGQPLTASKDNGFVGCVRHACRLASIFAFSCLVAASIGCALSGALALLLAAFPADAAALESDPWRPIATLEHTHTQLLAAFNGALFVGFFARAHLKARGGWRAELERWRDGDEGDDRKALV